MKSVSSSTRIDPASRLDPASRQMGRVYRRQTVLTVLVSTLGIAFTVCGQGTINFSNIGLNAPVLDSDEVTKLPGGTHVAQLYCGFTSDETELLPVGLPAPFLTGAADDGHWNGGSLTVPFAAPGQIVHVQVRVWDQAIGPVFESATEAWAPYGMSGVFPVTLGGGGTPPARLTGLTSFSLLPPLSTSVSAPGDWIVAAGRVDPGAATVRIFWDDGYSMRALAEDIVKADGSFVLRVPIPAKAPIGFARLGRFHSQDAGFPWLQFEVRPHEPGSLSGQVTDSSGAAVPLAPVRLLDDRGLPAAETTADEQGEFLFGALSPGIYRVDVPLRGYIPREVTVKPGDRSSVGILASSECDGFIPVHFPARGAMVLPVREIFSIGSYNILSPIQVGAEGNEPFARLASIQNQGLPELKVRFWAQIMPCALEDPGDWSIVRFRLGGQTREAELGPVFSTAPYDSVLAYYADFDSLQLPAGDLRWQVTIVTGGRTIGPYDLGTVQMVDLGGRWFAGHGMGPRLTITRHDSTSLHYAFQDILPQWAVDFVGDFDLFSIKKYKFTAKNRLRLGVPIQERFLSAGGTLSGHAAAEAELTILSIPFLDQRQFAYAGPAVPLGGRAEAASYSFNRRFEREYCVPVPGLGFDARKCIKFCVVGCRKCVGLKVGAFVCAGGSLDLGSTIDGTLGVRARAEPAVHVSADIRVQLSALVCDASAKVKGKADVKLPLVLDPPKLDFESPCLTLDASLHYRVKCFRKTFFKGRKTLYEARWGCASRRPASDSIEEEEEEPDPDHLELSHPSIAANRAGTAMAVWLPEAAAFPHESVRKPYFSLFHPSTGWTEAAPIYPENVMGEEPRVVWLDTTRALCVWTHSKLIPWPEVEDKEVDPDDPDQEHYLRGFELRYSIWNGTEWTEPILLTDDDLGPDGEQGRYDGRPVLAADPQSPSALLVWLRDDGDPIAVDEEAFPALFYAFYSDDGWTAPQRLDPASQSIDFQASVHYDPDGVPGVAWIRDLDADLETDDDRLLMFARFDFDVWSPEPVLDAGRGPWTPSLAFDRNGNPLIAYVLPSEVVDPETQISTLLGGDGNFSRLVVAFQRDAGWNFEPMGKSVFAERPIVRVNCDNLAIVMFRHFGFQHGGETGNLAAAVADMNNPASAWTYDLLTDDNRLNWQAAFDVAPCGLDHFLFWQKRDPETGPDIPGDNVLTLQPYEMDLAFAEPPVLLSNPEPVVGESIAVTAHIKNAGLRTLVGTPFTVSFYDASPDAGGVPFAQVSLDATDALPFGQIFKVQAHYLVPDAASRTIHVVLDREGALPEFNLANNRASTELAPSMPSNIEAIPIPDELGDTRQGVVALRWNPPIGSPDASFSVYRARRNEPAAFEFVGSTRGADWVDHLVEPGIDYWYQVVTVQNGIASAPSSPVSVRIEADTLVAEKPAPWLSGFALRERVILSWRGESEMVLEQTRALHGEATVWEPAEAAILESGRVVQASVPASTQPQFFRLRMP
jgi:hypothetical protein